MIRPSRVADDQRVVRESIAIGPLTIAFLLQNTLTAATRREAAR